MVNNEITAPLIIPWPHEWLNRKSLLVAWWVCCAFVDNPTDDRPRTSKAVNLLGWPMTMGRFRRFISLEAAICCKSTFESGHIICKHVNMSIYYHLFNIQPMRIFCKTGKRSEFWIHFKYAFCGSSCPHRHPYLRRKPSIVLHSQAPLVGFKAPVAQSIWVWRYLKPCIDKSWWNDIEMTQQPALVMHRHLPGFHW